MSMRTTRFLFLMLLGFACTFVLSGKALADSKTENENSQTTSLTTIEQSSQQSSEIYHDEKEVSINEQGSTESQISYVATSVDDSSSTIMNNSTSEGDKTLNSTSSKLSEAQVNTINPDTPVLTSSKYQTVISQYYYSNDQSGVYEQDQSSQSAFPATLQSSTSSGSLPVSTNLPIDGTGLVLRMLATVFQAGQYIVVSSSQVLTDYVQTLPSDAFFVRVVVAGSTALAVLVLVSILLSSWRKSGFTNAARSDVGDLNMIFAATKRRFVYYIASLFFVTANIKNKTI